MGEFDVSPFADLILEKNSQGNFIDKKWRLVNVFGYLIDVSGNIIDK